MTDTERPTDPAAAPDPVDPVISKLDLIYSAVMNLSDEVQRLGFRQREEASDVREKLTDIERRVGVLEAGRLNGHAER